MSILLNPNVCPAGPITGAIIKPPAWRVLNDHKRFVSDWDNFVKRARAWQHVHPLRKLDAWLWERHKNEMRAWWFSLSKFEQDHLKSIRADTGQYIVSHFNGPRYQRGSIILTAFGGSTGSSAATLALNSANNAATNIDVSPPSPLDAGFSIRRDGTHHRTNSAGINQINSTGDWVTPRNSTVGDDFEIIWNLTIGLAGRINDESYAEDTWATINVSAAGRYVGKSSSAPSISDTFEIDIGDDGTSTSDINQDYSVEAGDLV